MPNKLIAYSHVLYVSSYESYGRPQKAIRSRVIMIEARRECPMFINSCFYWPACNSPLTYILVLVILTSLSYMYPLVTSKYMMATKPLGFVDLLSPNNAPSISTITHPKKDSPSAPRRITPPPPSYRALRLRHVTAAGGATIGAVGGPRWRPDSSGPRAGCHGNGYNATGKTFPSVLLKVEDLNLEKAKRRGGGMMYMTPLRMMYMAPGGGGGGDTDSLSLGTNCETTAPLFGQMTAPGFAISKFTAPLFMDASEQPLEISIKW